MLSQILTDVEVEKEIERLRQSDLVALARKEMYIKNKRRQVLYQLRSFEKRGAELAANGVTIETLEDYLNAFENEETQ